MAEERDALVQNAAYSLSHTGGMSESGAAALAEAWMAAHDAQVRAEAWDEGYGVAEADAWLAAHGRGRTTSINPYRAAETEATR